MAELTKVFISYRRDDTRHVAGRMADRLDERFQVFMDIDTIEPGTDFNAVVRKAVGECDVLIAMIGNQWSTLTDDKGRRRLEDPHDWVVEELRVALHRDIRVIPVLVDGAKMPTAAVLPPSLSALANRQALPLRHESFASDSARLIAAIDRSHVTEAAVPPSNATGNAPSTPQERLDAQALYADPDYGAALVATFAEHWPDAITHLTRVAQRFPGQRQVQERMEHARRQQHLADLDGRAALAAAQGRWGDAVDALRLILEAEPKYKDAAQRLDIARRRGRIAQLQSDIRGLHSAQQWEGVVAAFDELVHLEPSAADPDGLVQQARDAMAENTLARRYAAGIAQLDQGNWATAFQVFNVISNERPDYREANQLREQARQQLQWSQWQTTGASTAPPPAPQSVATLPVTYPPAPPPPVTPSLPPPADPADENPRRRPLVITLIASAVFLLVVVVVLAVINLGKGPIGGGSGTETSSGQGNQSSVPPAQSNKEVLLSHIPADLVKGCQSFGVDTASKPGLRAALQCDPAGGRPEHTQYMLYDTAEAARNAYEVRLKEYIPAESDCSSGPGEHSYKRSDPDHHGVLGCYHTNAGFTILAWTDENLAMLCLVYDKAMSYGQLKDWWQGGGPV